MKSQGVTNWGITGLSIRKFKTEFNNNGEIPRGGRGDAHESGLTKGSETLKGLHQFEVDDYNTGL